ncbi:MAG: GMC family oxidoreductase N-terminal domain-containing protein [Lysobacterales bacterium]
MPILPALHAGPTRLGRPYRQVLLLEAGGRDWHPFVHMPAGLAKIAELTSINWNYTTTRSRTVGWARAVVPTRQLLGGSSSINAMCYIRGVAGDYDGWAAGGADGWHWDNVLPYFKRAEGNSRGSDAPAWRQWPAVGQRPAPRQPVDAVFIEPAIKPG